MNYIRMKSQYFIFNYLIYELFNAMQRRFLHCSDRFSPCRANATTISQTPLLSFRQT